MKRLLIIFFAFAFMSASAQVEAFHASNTVKASAPTTNVIASDNFNRSNSTDLGTATTGQTWEYVGGGVAGNSTSNFEVVGNKARCMFPPSSAGPGERYGVLPTSVSYGSVSANVTYSATYTQVRLVFQNIDFNNFNLVVLERSTDGSISKIDLYKLVAGTYTQLSTQNVSNAAGTTHNIKVTFNASNEIRVYNDGALITSINTTTGNENGTKHGISSIIGGGQSFCDGGDTTWDDFTVTD